MRLQEAAWTQIAMQNAGENAWSSKAPPHLPARSSVILSVIIKRQITIKKYKAVT